MNDLLLATEKDLTVRPMTAAERSAILPLTAHERYLTIKTLSDLDGGDLATKRTRRSLIVALSGEDNHLDILSTPLEGRKQLHVLHHAQLSRPQIEMVRDVLEAEIPRMKQIAANPSLDLLDRCKRLLEAPVEADNHAEIAPVEAARAS